MTRVFPVREKNATRDFPVRAGCCAADGPVSAEAATNGSVKPPFRTVRRGKFASVRLLDMPTHPLAFCRCGVSVGHCPSRDRQGGQRLGPADVKCEVRDGL